jgi:hypothetical protein
MIWTPALILPSLSEAIGHPRVLVLDDVLAINNQQEQFVAFVEKREGLDPRWMSGWCELGDIEYWMPLPAAPDVEKQEPHGSVYVEHVHVTQEQFSKEPVVYFDKIGIDGSTVTVHDEDGVVGHLIPDWMLRQIVREKLGLPLSNSDIS